MPIDVDEPQRLREIAAATVRVAQESGPRSVTIRAVAKEMGGSTALITNYVPSRGALMINAFKIHNQLWQEDLDEHIRGLTGIPRLRALVEWHCTRDDTDDVLRRLWIEMLAVIQTLPDDLTEASYRHSRNAYATIANAMVDVELPDLAADMLFLIIRGYFVASIEDPATWPPERAAVAALRAVDLLLAAR
ncbi:TetR/AcrR family transcriptional regulator [Streptomyces sp. NBC_01618]|uniref:TetR/AcrR family transcriptional regulator n=1 Tax=Streptomyces sp. NBC_01618 TaxID=2975900 RepID=UPI003868DF29|nr:TetR/AcrR family transcriptional regulator [Streptomyces sp. NBC_01618]